MHRYLDRWARDLIRRGIRAGLIEGSNVWLSIGAIAWLVRFLARKPSPVVSVQELRLGESIVVSHVPAPPRSRRARRKVARRAAKAEQRKAKEQAKREASRRYARARHKAAKQQAKMTASKANGAGRSGPGEAPVGRLSEGDEGEPA
ncbi:MAG: hypothetical protein ABSB52_01440 [Acidimicrobiales bacterium]